MGMQIHKEMGWGLKDIITDEKGEIIFIDVPTGYYNITVNYTLDTIITEYDLPSNEESYLEMWLKLSLKQINDIFKIPEFKGKQKLFSQITGFPLV